MLLVPNSYTMAGILFNRKENSYSFSSYVIAPFCFVSCEAGHVCSDLRWLAQLGRIFLYFWFSGEATSQTRVFPLELVIMRWGEREISRLKHTQQNVESWPAWSVPLPCEWSMRLHSGCPIWSPPTAALVACTQQIYWNGLTCLIRIPIAASFLQLIAAR